MRKPPKTAKELETIVMEEIRKIPKCSHITGVAITPEHRMADYHPNWNAQWIRDGSAARPFEADEIVQRLRGQFDLKD